MSYRSLSDIHKDMEVVLADFESGTTENRGTRLLMLRILIDEADKIAAEPIVRGSDINSVISTSTAACLTCLFPLRGKLPHIDLVSKWGR
jgi:hypothetical protein